MTKAIIFDLDNTLINTNPLKKYRDCRDWQSAYRNIDNCSYSVNLVNVIRKYKSQGIKIGIVSNSPGKYCKKLLDYMDLEVDCVLGYHDTCKHKPNPEPINSALEKLGFPDFIIGVGDNETDYIAYKEADKEIIAVNVTWYEDNKVEADATIDSVEIFDEFLEKKLYGDESNDYEALYEKLLKVDSDEKERTIYKNKKECQKKLNIDDRIDCFFHEWYYDTETKIAINAFKNNEKDAIVHFLVNAYLDLKFLFGENSIKEYCLAIVPSSVKNKWLFNMEVVVSVLSKKYGCEEATHVLRRIVDTPSSHKTNDRSVKKHLDSIIVDGDIVGKKIILLDEVVTSGASLSACRQLLLNAGAKEVYCYAFAYTEWLNMNHEDQAEPVIIGGGFDHDGYDTGGYDRNGCGPDGYNRYGYDRGGYDRDGYNQGGYNQEGYDRDGYDQGGYDRKGYNQDGYNRDGYNRDGYDQGGYDNKGYNQEGYNREGYNQEGYDREGYDQEGYNCEGYGRDGYNQEGYDCEGYGRDGYNQEGYDCEGYGREGYNQEGYNREGYDQDGYDQYMFNKNGINRYTGKKINSAGFLQNKKHYGTQTYYDLELYDIDGFDMSGFDRKGIHRDTHKKYDLNYRDKNGNRVNVIRKVPRIKK